MEVKDSILSLVKSSRDWYELEEIVKMIGLHIPMSVHTKISIIQKRLLRIEARRGEFIVRVNGMDEIDLFRMVDDELEPVERNFYLDSLFIILTSNIFVYEKFA